MRMALACLAPLVFLASGVPLASAWAATVPPVEVSTTLPVAGMQADVDLLEQAYTQLHPGLYRYNTPAQMAGHFATLRQELSRPHTLGEAYLAFSQFAAKVRCGHTYANFYNQPEAVAAQVLQSPTRVPFHFRWLQGRMIVLQNHSGDASLVPGTEVLAINDIPVERILQAMLSIARADGGNDDKRMSILQVTGSDRYNAFDVHLPLLFPQIGQVQRLSVRSPGDAAARGITVTALTDAQRESHRIARRAKAAQPWTLAYRGDGIAVLTMPSWALYDSGWDWQAWLQSSFEELARRRTPALVIDLRGNEGGLDVGQVLLAHLIGEPVHMPAYVRKTRYRSTPLALRPHLDTWDPSFHDWGEAATAQDDGFFRLQRAGNSDAGELVAPKAPRFAGRVALLVDASNSSATFEFSTAVKDRGLGLLVGQTTGGNRRGINGGSFFFLRLPNTGIELDLPLVGLFPPTPQPDGGVAPDVVVESSVDDIVQGRDAELAAALAALMGTASPATALDRP